MILIPPRGESRGIFLGNQRTPWTIPLIVVFCCVRLLAVDFCHAKGCEDGTLAVLDRRALSSPVSVQVQFIFEAFVFFSQTM